MKKIVLFMLLFPAGFLLQAQPAIFFDFVTHNEETPQWSVTNFYNANRQKLITLSDYFHVQGISWNMQSDHTYLSSVLTKETDSLKALTAGKNILLYMSENNGVEIDPHAHESSYIYPDVVKLMDSIGLPESKVIGGSVYNDFNGINLWTNLIYGQNGIVFPEKFWQPAYMMGGGTPNHVADLKYYGFWNPTDTDDYLTHNPASPLHHIGVGCELKIRDTTTVDEIISVLHELVNNVQSGVYPADGIYLQSIFFEQADLNDSNFYNKVKEIADSANAIVQSGAAQWKTLKETGDYWQTTYASAVFQWECGQVSTAVHDMKTDGLTVAPNPVIDRFVVQGNVVGNMGYELLDITGRLMKNGRLERNTETIDISGLPAGLYLFHPEKCSEVFRIVKL